MEKYYLLCGFVFMVCLGVVWAMHIRCCRKIEMQKAKNEVIRHYAVEQGITISGINLLLKNAKAEDLELMEKIINFHLDKIDKEALDPDITNDERAYKKVRESWIAIKQKVCDELQCRVNVH